MIHRVFTIEEKCTGCNKCIAACPVDCANQVYKAYDGTRKIKVDNDYCIHCGACLKACDHGARDYVDSTEDFFRDLTIGRNGPFTVVAAPAAQINFPDMGRVFGWLKALGVKNIYDVSFGADITTWAYLKAKKELNINSMIAQPCPSIVNYCERYLPELIDSLAPIQSPLMCLAIYLRRYLGIEGQIAFLSPCIAKSEEINDPNTENLVQYNVTFAKLNQKIKKDNVNLGKYSSKSFDGLPSGIGHVYSRPGGLLETVHLTDKHIWAREIHSPGKVYKYLQDYHRRKLENKPLPELVDILNCEGGCNWGTGTSVKVDIDDIDHMTNIKKRAKEVAMLREKDGEKEYQPNKYFDENLHWKDFKRNYANRNVHGFFRDNNLDDVFKLLHKNTPESRNINCYACGYSHCKRFAQAVKRGINVPDSCIDYERNLLKIDRLTNLLNHGEMEESMTRFTNWHRMAPFDLVIIMMDIDDFKHINDTFGHDVGDLALKSVSDIIRMHTRPSDFPGRWGGDEFMLILPHTNVEKAKEIAQNIQQSIINAKVLPDGEGFTSSMGLSPAKVGDKSLDLFRRADHGLYLAKEHKRNPNKPALCIVTENVD